MVLKLVIASYSITHLFFADDSFILFKANMEEYDELKGVLQRYDMSIMDRVNSVYSSCFRMTISNKYGRCFPVTFPKKHKTKVFYCSNLKTQYLFIIKNSFFSAINGHFDLVG